MSKRSSLVSLVPAVIAGAWIAHAVAASPEDERRLDNTGSSICRESSALERAVAGARQMRREAAKAAQQMDRGDEAEQRRAFLQNEFNQRALGAQEQKEQDWQSSKGLMKQALADGEEFRLDQVACEDWKILQQPAEQVERWRPGYRAEAQSRFAAFSSDYRRRTGKSCDTGSCR